MKYLHTMVRVADLGAARHFYCQALGLKELQQLDYERGRYSLVFLCAPGDSRDLARVICLALERIRTDDSIRVRARQRVESQFSLAAAVAANIAMYEEVIQGGHRA